MLITCLGEILPRLSKLWKEDLIVKSLLSPAAFEDSLEGRIQCSIADLMSARMANEIRWNYAKIFAVRDWPQLLTEIGLIRSERRCSKHRVPMVLLRNNCGQFGRFRCPKCRITYSVAKDTWFEGAHLSPRDIFSYVSFCSFVIFCNMKHFL